MFVSDELRNELRNELGRNAFVFLVIHGGLFSFRGFVEVWERPAADPNL